MVYVFTICTVLTEKMFLFFSDGEDFLKYEVFECSPKFGNYDSLSQALDSCRQDADCSMVGSTNCADSQNGYYYCKSDPDLIPNEHSTACTHRKKSNFDL